MSTACPDEDEIVAYAQGHIGPQQRERIAAHVDECEACIGLVAEAARAEATHPLVADEPAPSPGRGSVLGRYLVLELIGTGGLGRVFSAYDPELDRRVAIKLIASRVGSRAELGARLVREAQALAKVRHPNVVAVHDVGMVDGHVFVAMELVEGSSMREWLLAEPRPWPQIRDAFVDAARGLAAVHEAGLVHRDVKPANILVGHDARVQVADFGLARALGHDLGAVHSSSDTPHDPLITASGAVIGTPAYMAPEQHRGGPIDARADQFGFGVALFEALHGVRPFAGSTREQLLAAASAGAIVDGEPRRVPGWLRRVALRAIAADPERRFASMHALVDALQHDRSVRRRRTFAGALGLVLGGAAVWGLVIAPALAPDPSARDAVDALVDEARAAAARTHFVHPPSEAPSQPTAYTKVLELEAHEGSAATLADEQAALLRGEFSGTLVELGDRFWAIEGGAPFASEYYAAALLFADDNPRALARAGVSIASVVALRERAASLAFTQPELTSVAPVLALASDDDDERMRRIEHAYEQDPEPPPPITAALEQVLGARGHDAIARGRAQRGLAPQIPTPRVALPEPSAPAVAADPPAAPRGPTAAPKPVTRSESDRASARAHVEAGRAALRRGELARAESAFHRALGADRTEVDALAGLAEVTFQQRAYEASAGYLERALVLAPRSAGLHLELGDVYFKVLRYADARAQYDEARALGHSGASRRIARLDARLGAP